jgi:hypothetical protein
MKKNPFGAVYPWLQCVYSFFFVVLLNHTKTKSTIADDFN